VRPVSAALGRGPRGSAGARVSVRQPQPCRARARPLRGGCVSSKHSPCAEELGTWLVAEPHGPSAPGGARGLRLAEGPPAHQLSGPPSRGCGGHRVHALPSRRRPGTAGPPALTVGYLEYALSWGAARPTVWKTELTLVREPEIPEVSSLGVTATQNPRGQLRANPCGQGQGRHIWGACGDVGVLGLCGGWAWVVPRGRLRGTTLLGSRRHSPVPHAADGRELPPPGWPGAAPDGARPLGH